MSSIRPRLLACVVAAAAGVLSTAHAVAQQDAQSRAARQAKRPAGNFDMAGYLQGLSEKGKAAGYKEVVYKQTPQGELRMYLALPEGWKAADKRPAVVYFYGGGWSGGNVFSYDEQSAWMAKCGLVACMADYRVRTRHDVNPDKCVEDARSAVRYLRTHCTELGIDPDRVIAGGGSAGAHIAACTAVPTAPNSDTDDLSVSCKPNGLLLCFPPTTVVELDGDSYARKLLGDEMGLKLSPASHVTKDWPPTVQFFGTADRLLKGGLLLHSRAREAGVKCEVYLAAGQGHGFVNMEPWHEVSSKYAVEFFMAAGVIPQRDLPPAPADQLRRYEGEPFEEIATPAAGNPSRELLEQRRKAGGAN